ncbi:DUF3833 domain-containing protein [Vibrio agarivorans]|uniref:DUF3833 domain-containing protein n=1 Tax=Vibrio agarivorans TaxID=153622 RepID=UPI0025B2965A|nr:DUF3833 domain-containing protein [Vibrio agarivorans]MDN3662943.1 DUF3833 domain-containing protein [Vibrio agarivorans]
MLKRWFIASLLVLVAACSADLEDYAQTTPPFALFEFFEGETQAWGMVQDYTGKQTRRFDVKIVGSIDGDTLTLVEDFTFADGEISQRIWTIKNQGGGAYIGTADDVIGEAHGHEEGNALYWEYEMALSVDGDVYHVTFEDWMYRQDERHMFNVAVIKKFGIEVGKVTLFFVKR